MSVPFKMKLLISANFTNVTKDGSIWDNLYTTMQTLLTILEQLQQGNITHTGGMDWFNLILSELQTFMQASQNRWVRF